MTVKEMRTKMGMSQREFADYLQISVRKVQSWEQGFRNPPKDMVNLIERVLKLEGKI